MASFTINFAVPAIMLHLMFLQAECSSNSEPQITCVSQFDYDYKTLQRVVETEYAQKELIKTVADQQQNIEALAEKLSRLENLQANDVSVAFTAIVSSGGLTGLSPGEILIFDRVITNLGRGYQSNTGTFTAPVNGLYVFNMDIMVRAGQRQYAEFMKNGQHLLSNYAKATDAKHFVSSSRTVTVELLKGDNVWIQTPNKSNHGDGIVHGNGFSTFSGWLI